jgi:hypothetical protein
MSEYKIYYRDADGCLAYLCVVAWCLCDALTEFNAWSNWAGGIAHILPYARFAGVEWTEAA